MAAILQDPPIEVLAGLGNLVEVTDLVDLVKIGVLVAMKSLVERLGGGLMTEMPKKG